MVNDINNISEDLRKELEEYLNFMKNFDRGTREIEIEDKKGVLNLASKDGNKIKIELKLWTARDSYEIRRLREEKKFQEADFKSIIAGLKSWNLVDEKDNELPINEKTVGDLPEFFFAFLLTVVKAKNRDIDLKEIKNFFK